MGRKHGQQAPAAAQPARRGNRFDEMVKDADVSVAFKDWIEGILQRFILSPDACMSLSLSLSHQNSLGITFRLSLSLSSSLTSH